MSEDSRLDTKLAELARELMLRPLVPGYTIQDAFTMRGIDEIGKPGMFAAVLLGENPPVELDTLTRFRHALTARLKQINTGLPAWPIVVQGAPELIDGAAVVPGGKEYFTQLKGELSVRRQGAQPKSTRESMLVAPMSTRAPAPPATGKKSRRPLASARSRRARK